MLYIAGGFFILLGLIRLIVIIATSGRPKMEVPIKDFTFLQLSTDLFGFGGKQKHAKVAYVVDGKDYEADVFVGKKFNTPVGGNIKISYPSSNPKNPKYYNPKMEWTVVLVFLIFGGILCALSQIILSALS